jgi:hypothetical protein
MAVSSDGICEHDDSPLGYIKARNFLTILVVIELKESPLMKGLVG